MVAALLEGFTDRNGAAAILDRAPNTVSDMAGRGVLDCYRVGTVVLFWAPQVRDVAAALRRLQARSAPVPMDAGRAL